MNYMHRSMLFVNVYFDITIVHACLCLVCVVVRVCECLSFILILPKGEQSCIYNCSANDGSDATL